MKRIQIKNANSVLLPEEIILFFINYLEKNGINTINDAFNEILENKDFICEKDFDVNQLFTFVNEIKIKLIGGKLKWKTTKKNVMTKICQFNLNR